MRPVIVLCIALMMVALCHAKCYKFYDIHAACNGRCKERCRRHEYVDLTSDCGHGSQCCIDAASVRGPL
ncbi:hypothetical protein AALO_G00028750 [Alosa alosa]|uniref:Beta-defensin n=1 Tax=Alosa alosa TaxID=278164 RepID=A0AAV6HF89_9TELE|nr:hypothetical protein AALO_G00028750 [Alosa alosa]